MATKENAEPVGTAANRHRGKWRDSHVVMLILPIVLTILFAGKGIFYLSGRFWPDALALAGIMWLLVIASGFILCCFILGIVRLVGVCRGKRTRKESLLILAETGIPLVYFGLFLVPHFFAQEQFCGRPHELFALGLRDRIESKADIEATRAWLQSLRPEEYKDRGRISSAELPEALRALKGARASLWSDANGNAVIRLLWGSGIMGHWGAMIGMKDMETPPSDFRLYGSYILSVEPGVYVWWRFE
jgi:hypothetical protein